jgi:flagellar hook protein FlgE
MSTMTTFDYGVAAMLAHSEAMGAISQNIANMRTAGYKRADVQFASMIANPLPGDHVAGSVVAQTKRLVDMAGTFERTGRALDLALDGPGMFVYSTTPAAGGELFYSRNGALGSTALDAATANGVSYLSAYDDLYLMAWPIDATGKVSGTGASDLTAIPQSLAEGFTGRATSSASLTATIPASGTATASFELFRYDDAGLERRIFSDWTNTAPNTWTASFRDGAGAPIGGTTAVTFDGAGSLLSPSTLDVGGLFSLDVSKVRQLGVAPAKTAFAQDGLGSGDFLNWDIAPGGVVSAVFGSGAVTPLYQLPVALFSNMNGLAAESRGLFAVTSQSGAPSFEAAGKTAAIVSGSQELSNVSLEDSFSQMIVTQRAYASAAQIVQTADEMSKTVRDLR